MKLNSYINHLFLFDWNILKLISVVSCSKYLHSIYEMVSTMIEKTFSTFDGVVNYSLQFLLQVKPAILTNRQESNKQ